MLFLSAMNKPRLANSHPLWIYARDLCCFLVFVVWLRLLGGDAVIYSCSRALVSSVPRPGTMPVTSSEKE